MQKTTHMVGFHLYEMSRIGKSIVTEIGLVVARAGWGGRGRDGDWLLMGMRFPFGVRKMFESYIVVMVAQLREYAKNHCTMHCKKWILWYENYLLWFLFVTVSWEDFHSVWRVCLICRLHKIHLGVTSRRPLEKTKQPKQIPKGHMWLAMERNINNSITLFIQQITLSTYYMLGSVREISQCNHGLHQWTKIKVDFS